MCRAKEFVNKRESAFRCCDELQHLFGELKISLKNSKEAKTIAQLGTTFMSLGANPFHKAFTPSTSTRSRILAYVPTPRPSSCNITRVFTKSKGCVATDATAPATTPLTRLIEREDAICESRL
mmetsp:Transcript_76322/g.205122  ORF Transcript_76322/g.205122 Transcript_76322/m.205122 type:complete len:123 (-) Transcript_76322:853-1221(-)